MKYNILIVDDDPHLLDALKRNFYTKKDEYNAVFSTSADDALNKCETEPFDFIISDYKMPGMNGLSMLEIIKKKYPSMKRILLTGQSENEIFDKAMDFAQKYISKPCSAADIIKIIENMK